MANAAMEGTQRMTRVLVTICAAPLLFGQSGQQTARIESNVLYGMYSGL